jgi:hypothetical protein
MLLALVVGGGPASGGPRLGTGDSAIGTALVSAPPPASVQAAGDLLVATASAARGGVDASAGWAEPATVSVLLAAPVGFFVGLTDTSDVAGTGHAVRQVRGRSPPPAAALALR